MNTVTSLWGGLFSFLEQKSTLKLRKTCYFAYFSGQWGGYNTICPPPPSYATALAIGTVAALFESFSENLNCT